VTLDPKIALRRHLFVKTLTGAALAMIAEVKRRAWA
jgi:hypothetical protein